MSPMIGLSEKIKGQLNGLDVQVKTLPTSWACPEDEDGEVIEYMVGQIKNVVEFLSRPDNKVKWAQTTSAGVDYFFKNIDRLKLAPGFQQTRTNFIQRGQMMAEYVIGQILSRERNFLASWEAQKKCSYDKKCAPPYRMLTELTVGILGVGELGREVARVCKSFGMQVWAGVTDRRFQSGESPSPYVDHVRPMSRLPEVLEQSDYLVTVLPSTPETRGLLSGDVLQPCRLRVGSW
ncbi:uncharacterized protein LOC131930356 [Physella acuta]|uniref:uncharacterized protein LOC131930356 n=1 Tax=Physella acuta TaxID=109671 RepID=UPI0027DAD417|nr:uncharacterized protein LOC131930356 [Physella acuta]